MNFKLIASQNAGKYKKGDQVTDPAEIEVLLAGSMRKRFVRTPMHEGEIAPAPADPAPADPAPSAE